MRCGQTVAPRSPGDSPSAGVRPSRSEISPCRCPGRFPWQLELVRAFVIPGEREFHVDRALDCVPLDPADEREIRVADGRQRHAQAELQQKIVAIEHKDALERVMASHFLPDLIGNTRAFSRQNFRCTKCNTRYRRIPLVGHCTKCGGNIILTIAEGSARKYLEIAKAFILKYALSPYIKQRVDLIEREMNSVFQSEGAVTKQKSLAEFV